MADSNTAPTEVAVADVRAHMQSVWNSGQAHIALITSRPDLYPGGLPVSLDAMRKQLTFANQQLQTAMPAAPVAAASQPPAS